MADTENTEITTATRPASRLASGQFINIQRLHVAKLLTDSTDGATYDEPVDLGKVLRSIDIKPSNSQADLYADGQSIDTASSTASYELTFDTAALPLAYTAYLLGHSYENGVMVANKDDVAPYFAVLFQSDKRNGKARYMKFYKVQFQEPSIKGSTKEENISYQTPTLTAKAIYRLSDGNCYTYADNEDAGFTAESAANWYKTV